jgi:transcriptional regulator with XRE-family HTH domain
VPHDNVIGDYLRARRGLVRPQDVELPHPSRRRRVAGLRRDEVALLAGVSTEYYIRLEQGRDRNPSRQVIDALARALQLDDDATAYLHRLAALTPRPPNDASRPETVPVGILQLLASWNQTPAHVEGRYLDTLAANPLATALYPYCVVGANMVRVSFLDPRAREMHIDWEEDSETAVLKLRRLVGADVGDPRLNALVDELSASSDRFRELWARHDARPRRSSTRRLEHPTVGRLELRYERLPIPDTDRQHLTIYHAEPGSRSAQALAQLATVAD